MPFQVKVPFDLVIKLRDRLEGLSAIHNAEMAAAQKKLKMAGPTEANLAEADRLRERGKRLTLHYMLRACIVAGAGVLDKKDDALLSLISEDTVKVGRPSGARAA
jgi:hypothetical protein